MTIVLGIAAVGVVIFGFLKIDELPTIGGWSILAGFILLSVAIGGGSSGSGDCWTDWDGRSNPTVCD